MSRPNFRERGYDRTYDRNKRKVKREETHCWWCGEPVDKSLRWPDPLSASVDHVVPREKGGTNERHNLRLAHLKCNSARVGLERPKRKRPAEQHPGLLT